MYSTIIFLSILIIFLSLMLMIDIGVRIDINKNLIQITIKVYKIKIIVIDIDIIGMFYKINNSKKVKSLNIFFTKEQEYLFMQIKESILDKLYYDKLEFNSEINIVDPCVTAESVGILNLICWIIRIYLLNKNEDITVVFNNKSNFINNANKIYLKVRVYFTIFDMIFALVMSFYKRGKYVKQKKSTTQS